MNLVELMKKHPGQKYRHDGWHEKAYVFKDNKSWVDETGAFIEGLVGIQFADERWELYEEPTTELNITADDVGKKVKLRDGSVAIILEFMKHSQFPINTMSMSYTQTGHRLLSRQQDSLDIVEILEGE
jgi:hypothetical protein